MIILHNKLEMLTYARQARLNGLKIGLVPTMGALHAGHMSLIQKASTECQEVVVSIFVNPLQFGANEDLDKYPRRLAEDAELCCQHGATVIFAPTPDEMYVQPTETLIYNLHLDDLYCGAYRPGHFKGVLTVVAKLFNLVQPDFAYFGAKDYQQLHQISKMVRDLDFPIGIRSCPIVRAENGLALSSRNEYLSAEHKIEALGISRGLGHAQNAFDQGERDSSVLADLVQQEITYQSSAKIQFIEVLDRETMLPQDHLGSKGVILVAVYYGPTRLIDNIELGPL